MIADMMQRAMQMCMDAHIRLTAAGDSAGAKHALLCASIFAYHAERYGA